MIITTVFSFVISCNTWCVGINKGLILHIVVCSICVSLWIPPECSLCYVLIRYKGFEKFRAKSHTCKPHYKHSKTTFGLQNFCLALSALMTINCRMITCMFCQEDSNICSRKAYYLNMIYSHPISLAVCSITLCLMQKIPCFFNPHQSTQIWKTIQVVVAYRCASPMYC